MFIISNILGFVGLLAWIGAWSLMEFSFPHVAFFVPVIGVLATLYAFVKQHRTLLLMSPVIAGVIFIIFFIL